MSESEIGLIILAAGNSTRLGHPKQLLPFRGQSLLRHSAQTALASVCRPVVAVLGAHAARLVVQLSWLPVRSTFNPLWQEGMASSIRAGLEALRETQPVRDKLKGVILMLCDQPLITADHLNRLVEMHTAMDSGIVASDYGTTIGVPALFDRRYFSVLESVTGNEGAKKVIIQNLGDLATIYCPDSLLDIDTEADYRRLRAEENPLAGYDEGNLPASAGGPLAGNHLDPQPPV